MDDAYLQYTMRKNAIVVIEFQIYHNITKHTLSKNKKLIRTTHELCQSKMYLFFVVDVVFVRFMRCMLCMRKTRAHKYVIQVYLYECQSKKIIAQKQQNEQTVSLETMPTEVQEAKKS